MKIFIDTEFNGHLGELISMALVAENGDEFYEVLDHSQMRLDPWVAEHVIPILGKEPLAYVDFQKELSSFLNRYEDIEIIADWPDDIRYLCQSLITRPGQKLTTPDLKFRVVDIKDLKPELPHNALSDARAIAQRVFSGYHARMRKLTKREKEVMGLVLDGMTNKEIANLLDLSHRTVELHRSRVMTKMQAKSAVDLTKIVCCR